MLFFLWRFSVHFGLWCLNMNGSLFFYLREFSLKFSFSFRSFDMSDSFVMLFLLWRFNVHFSLWCLNMNGSLDMLYCRNFSLVLSFGCFGMNFSLLMLFRLRKYSLQFSFRSLGMNDSFMMLFLARGIGFLCFNDWSIKFFEIFVS